MTAHPTPQLIQFAEVLLGEYFPDFQTALNDFQQMDPTLFGEKYPCFQFICDDLDELDEDEKAEVDFAPILLLLYAKDKNLMARVDWAGEDEPGEVASFVSRIMETRKIDGFTWNTNDFDATLHFETLQRGDYILLLLKAIDQHLKTLGCRLVLFFIGDDSYPYTVLPEKEFAKVDRLTWDIYGVFSAENMNEYHPSGAFEDWDEEESDEDNDQAATEPNESAFETSLVARKTMQLYDSEHIECASALSKDKNLLAVCSIDGLIRLVETKTGTVRTLPHLHSDRCVSLTFSEDGTRLLSPSFDATVRIWDTKTGNPELKLDMLGAACFGTFSPDNQTICTGLMGPIFSAQFWNNQGECQSAFEKHKNFIWEFLFLDKNQVLSFAADKTPYLLDTTTGKPLRAFKGHKKTVYCAKISSDKSKLLTGSEDNTVRLWDLTDDKKTPTVFSHHSETIGVLCLAEKDQSFLSADLSGKIILVDMETGEVKRTFDGHRDMVSSLRISDDNKNLLSASADGWAILWSLETGEKLAAAKHGSMLVGAEFIDENHFVTLCEADGILFWELAENDTLLPEQPKRLDTPEPPKVQKESTDEDEKNPLGLLLAKLTKVATGIEALEKTTSHDGKYSLETDIENCLRLFDEESRECLYEFGKHCEFKHLGWLGKTYHFYLRNTSVSLGIQIWDAQTVTQLSSIGSDEQEYKRCPGAVATDESGKMLLYGTSSGKSFLYDTKTGCLIHEFGEESTTMGSGISAVAMYPDGSKAVTAKYNGHLFLWCTKSGKMLFMSDKLPNSIEKIKIMPNGKLKVRDNLMGQTIVDPNQVEESDYDPSQTAVISAETIPALEPRLTIPSIRGNVAQLIVSPDESMLAGVGQHGDIRIYDTKDWSLRRLIPIEEYGLHRHEADSVQINFSSDGAAVLIQNRQSICRIPLEPSTGKASSWPIPKDGDWENEYRIHSASSPDGTKIFFCGPSHSARLYDLATGNKIQEYSFKNKRYELYGPIFSPDGKRIVFTNNASLVRVLDIETGNISEWPMPKLEAYPLSWSSDGSLILVSVKKKLLFLDSTSGTTVQEIPTSRENACLARLSADKKILLLGLEYDYRLRLQVIRLDTNETLYEKKSLGSCPAVFFDHDKSLAIGGQDISILHTDRFEEKVRLEGFEGKLYGAAILPPGEEELILSDEGTGRVVELESGKETGRFNEMLLLNEKYPISPDGKTLLDCHSDEVAIFDIPQRKFIKKYPEHGGNCGPVVAPDFSIVVAGKDEKRVAYRIPDGKKLFNLTAKNTVENISFSPNGKWILMADWSPSVRIFEASSGKLVFEKNLEEYNAYMPEARFIDDTRYFIRYNQKHLEVFDAQTHECLSSVKKKEIPLRQFLVVSPDARFYIGHQFTKGVEIVDLKTGKTLRSDPIGEKCISSFAPDLNQNRLFYGTVDGTIRVMNVNHWSWTHTIEGIGSKLDGLIVSPDSRRLAARHATGMDIFETKTFRKLASVPLQRDKHGAIMHTFHFGPEWKHLLKIGESSLQVFDLPAD